MAEGGDFWEEKFKNFDVGTGREIIWRCYDLHNVPSIGGIISSLQRPRRIFESFVDLHLITDRVFQDRV